MRLILPLLWSTAAGGSGAEAIWLQKAIFHRAGILSTTYCRIDVNPLPIWVMEGVWQHLVGTGLRISQRLDASAN